MECTWPMEGSTVPFVRSLYIARSRDGGGGDGCIGHLLFDEGYVVAFICLIEALTCHNSWVIFFSFQLSWLWKGHSAGSALWFAFFLLSWCTLSLLCCTFCCGAVFSSWFILVVHHLTVSADRIRNHSRDFMGSNKYVFFIFICIGFDFGAWLFFSSSRQTHLICVETPFQPRGRVLWHISARWSAWSPCRGFPPWFLFASKACCSGRNK